MQAIYKKFAFCVLRSKQDLTWDAVLERWPNGVQLAGTQPCPAYMTIHEFAQLKVEQCHLNKTRSL